MSIHPSTRLLIKLTTHPTNFGVDPEPLEWFAEDPVKRGRRARSLEPQAVGGREQRGGYDNE